MKCNFYSRKERTLFKLEERRDSFLENGTTIMVVINDDSSSVTIELLLATEAISFNL